jgi:hypothetical protein
MPSELSNVQTTVELTAPPIFITLEPHDNLIVLSLTKGEIT